VIQVLNGRIKHILVSGNQASFIDLKLKKYVNLTNIHPYKFKPNIMTGRSQNLESKITRHPSFHHFQATVIMSRKNFMMTRSYLRNMKMTPKIVKCFLKMLLNIQKLDRKKYALRVQLKNKWVSHKLYWIRKWNSIWISDT